MEYVASILPVVTLIIGYFGTILTEERREERAAKREHQRSQKQFRQETLRELQSTLTVLYMADLSKLAAQEVHFQATGNYSIQAIGQEWRQKHDEALPRSWILRSFVEDARTLELLDLWDDAVSRFSKASSHSDAHGALAYEGSLLKLIVQRAGEVVRELDAGPNS